MKTTIKMTMLALLVTLTLTSCKKEYTIVVESNNVEWGTVDGSGTYADGAEVKIAAYPASGYYFIGWQDGDASNPRTIVVTADATYRAIFSNDPNGGGTGGDPTDPTTWSGSISENVTWPDRGLEVDYIIDGMLFIEGNALLTVEPGVTIMFTSTTSGIDVGENAGLRMVGTATNPIVLEGPSNNPNNGSWDYVSVRSNRSDNQFEYVQFLRGCSGTHFDDGVVEVDGKLSMKYCTVDGSLASGVVLGPEGTLSAFQGNTVTNCTYYPIYSSYITPFCHSSNISADNTYTSNRLNMVCISSNYTEEEDITMQALSIPYYLSGGMYISSDISFTIEAGTELVMGDNAAFEIDGDFSAVGTASNPIVFRGMEDTPSWNGIMYTNDGQEGQMSYCRIQNAGVGTEYHNSSCLYIGSGTELTMTNLIIGPSGHYGVYIDNIEDWGNITHSGNTFTQCSAGNVYIGNAGEYGGTEYTEGQILTDLP